jgi:polysaccharide biosynthesis/export protein
VEGFIVMLSPTKTALRALPAVFAALLLAGCAAGTGPREITGLPPDPPATSDANYVIGPGDALGIFVFRSPELSVDLPVRPDGRISMPLIPDIQAAGRTPTQLARDIETRLRDFVREPNVTVMVRSFVGPTSRMVRVIGEAAEPIAIPFREGMTLLDVLIQSRGLTRFAAGNRAEVIRREPGQPPQAIPVRLNDLVRGGDITQDIPMRPGDTLVIPQSWF